MLTAIGSVLVAGSLKQEEVVAETKTVKVLRAFYHNRKRYQPGETVSLPSIFARELQASNKAKIVDPQLSPAAVAPPAKEAAKDPPAAGMKKEKKDTK